MVSIRNIFFGLILTSISYAATCNPDKWDAGCPSVAPATGAISGTAYLRTGVTGIDVVQGIQYDTPNNTTCTPPNSSCEVMDCFSPHNATASTGIEIGPHSGGGNSGQRDKWIGLDGLSGHHYGPIVFSQLTKRTHCNFDYLESPGSHYPAGVQNLRCAIMWLIQDAGATVPGNRNDIVLIGDSWSNIFTMNVAFTNGLITPWADSCTAPISSNFKITGIIDAYGVICTTSAACTYNAYHYTASGAAVAMRLAINNSLGSSDETTAIAADLLAQMSPIYWITQGNPNLVLLRLIIYGINDSLVCHQQGLWDNSATSCGGTPGSQNPMNDWVAINTLKGLNPSIIVPNIGYSAGGHEGVQVFTGNVRDDFYQTIIGAINNSNGANSTQ